MPGPIYMWMGLLATILVSQSTRGAQTSFSSTGFSSSGVTTNTNTTTVLVTTTTTTATTPAPTTNLLCRGSLLMEPSGTLWWEVGTVNNVSCSVAEDSSSSLTASDLYIFKGQVSLPHQVVDNYTITVSVEATEPTDYYLTCTDSSQSNFCFSKVFVGYPPLDVESFSCVSYNWNSLRCRWTIPYNPAQSTSQDYKPYLITTTTADDELRGQCGCESLEVEGEPCNCPKTCCTWLPPQYASVDEYVYVVFRTENNLGSAAFRHNVSNYAIVLPDEASDVRVEPTAKSRLLKVSWRLPSPMEVFAGLACVAYRVDHRLLDASDSPWTTREDGRCCSEDCEGRAEVEADHWWKEYEVRVRLRSGSAPETLDEDGWWSGWSSANASTPPSAPESAPSVGPGTYQVSERRLVVSWRPIPPLLHNGPGFFYEVAATSDEGTVVEPSEVRDSFATFLDLDTYATYTVEVVAVNNLGRSNVSSVVKVEGIGKLPSAPVLPVVVRYSPNYTYELRWSNDDPDGITYTVYVCTDDQEDQMPCTTNLYWTNVGNVSAVNLTLTEEGSAKVRFAVSAETFEGASSGMSWDRCGKPRPYHKTSNPPSLSRPTDLHKTTALVPWTLDCNDRAAVVEGIEARYCIGSFNFTSQCTGGSKTYKAVKEVVKLTGLKEATQYTVWLRLQYRSGVSKWSNGQTFVTLEDGGLAIWVVGVITAGAVVAAVVIVFLLSYSWRGLANIMKEVNRGVNLPDGLLPTDPKYPPEADGSGQDSFSLRPKPIVPVRSSELSPNKPTILRSALAQMTEEGRRLHLGEEKDNCINQAAEWAKSASVGSGDGGRCPSAGETSPCSDVLPGDSTPSDMTIRVNPCEAMKGEDKANEAEENSPGRVTPESGFGTRDADFKPVRDAHLQEVPVTGRPVQDQGVGGSASPVDSSSLLLIGNLLKGVPSQATPGYIRVDQLMRDNRFEVSETRNEGIEPVEYGDETQERQKESLWRESLASEELPPGYRRIGEIDWKSPIL